ncbi:MAG: hypothetical protein HUJ25_00120 [Crocinitomicaceae bacterium]|nr:hypothetical protein [Crocinitomicaceae bacterium]
MTDSEDLRISRVLLLIVYIILSISLLILSFYLFVMFAMASGWGGNNRTNGELLYEMKSIAFITIISIVALIGQIAKKKFGFTFGIPIGLSFSLFGLIASISDLIRNIPFNHMDLIMLILFISIGGLLAYWTFYEMKKNNFSIGKSWISMVIVSTTSTCLFLMDWYYI